MLKSTVQKIRDTTIVRCQGRIIVGEDFSNLRDAVMRNSSAAMVVLDLAGVRRVDAGGLGMLLGLHEWAEGNAIRLKLMNVMPEVERMLRLTKLDRVFEFCSIGDMFCLVLLAHLPGSTDIPKFRKPGYAAFGKTVTAGR